MRSATRSLVLGALAALVTLGCEDKPAPAPVASATAAAVPTPAPTPAPTPEPTAAPAAKPKKKLSDCPKTKEVEFAQKDIELEVRRKLPKPEGPITTADLRKLKSLNLSQSKLSELDVACSRT